MKVLHLSHFDRKGGACIAAYRQHQALRAEGVDSEMWVRHKLTNDPHVFEYRPQSDMSARVRRIVRRQWLGLQKKRAQPTGEIYDDRSEHHGMELLKLPEHDVINVQFSQGFVDLPALLHRIPASTPLVFTLHEMSMFTGGCSYAYDCRGFEKQCGKCPQLRIGKTNDFSRRSWLRKHEAFTQRDSSNLHFAADSHWIASEAAKSSLLKDHAVSTMHYGVDTSIFRPLDAMACKEILRIPTDRSVIAFAAVSVADKRKGASYLIQAIQQMKEKPFLLTWGASFPPELEELPHLHLGSIDSEHLLATVYNAADVFVIPSIEEAFGQTALEALACGLPVVGSDVGGIPDMVRDGETGLLVERGNAAALAEALDQLAQDQDKRAQLGSNGRELVLREFSFQKNAESYLGLYQTMINSCSSR